GGEDRHVQKFCGAIGVLALADGTQGFSTCQGGGQSCGLKWLRLLRKDVRRQTPMSRASGRRSMDRLSEGCRSSSRSFQSSAEGRKSGSRKGRTAATCIATA